MDKDAVKIDIENEITVSDENAMRLDNGKVIKTLRELAHVLSEMSDDVFKKHVSDDKSEFAEWVKEVHKKEKLAEELMQDLSREGHKNIVFRHVKNDYRD